MSTIELEYIKLPDTFCRLLTFPVQEKLSSYERIHDILSEDQFLCVVLDKFFKTSNDQTHFHLIRKHGWRVIRNKIAILYLNYLVTGDYKPTKDSHLIQKILKLEEDFEQNISSDNSKIFLLGFYNKVNELKGSHVLSWELRQDLSIFLGRSRSQHLDIILICLSLLRKVWGNVELDSRLKANNYNFSALISTMNTENKEFFYRNFLNYLMSTKQAHLFHYNKV